MVYNGTETLTFLGPRIWEIVPGYIKKSNSFEEFKLKIKLWNPENRPCRLIVHARCEVSLRLTVMSSMLLLCLFLKSCFLLSKNQFFV